MKFLFKHAQNVEKRILQQIEESEKQIAEDNYVLSLIHESQQKAHEQLFGRRK